MSTWRQAPALVCFVDPGTRTATVYSSPTGVVTLLADDFLEGGRVLPGFRCQPADFF